MIFLFSALRRNAPSVEKNIPPEPVVDQGPENVLMVHKPSAVLADQLLELDGVDSGQITALFM